MKRFCIIPARGGSKRIPGKNIKPFLGKPILDYPLETAKRSGLFNDIRVYSDDVGILDFYSGYAEKRESVNDYETLTETIIKYLNYHLDPIDYLCVLLPTAVFVNTNDLIRGFQELSSVDASITFCEYSHPVQRAFCFNGSRFNMVCPEFEFTRTQDLPRTYYDAGQMYFLKVDSFLKQKKIFMDKIHPIFIDAVDIDSEIDWKKAEVFYEAR